jgi:hypothetical protein
VLVLVGLDESVAFYGRKSSLCSTFVLHAKAFLFEHSDGQEFRMGTESMWDAAVHLLLAGSYQFHSVGMGLDFLKEMHPWPIRHGAFARDLYQVSGMRSCTPIPVCRVFPHAIRDV